MADCPICGNSLLYKKTEQNNRGIKVILECMNPESVKPDCSKKEFYVYADLKNLKY